MRRSRSIPRRSPMPFQVPRQPVYERIFRRLIAAALLTGAAVVVAPRPAHAQLNAGDAAILDAREAWRKKDRVRLAALRTAVQSVDHPLAVWVDYWELVNRIAEIQPDEADAFMTRWAGTYLEDRFRNDWLLQLGKRRDWEHFAVQFPRFRMNDDREVTCYALLVDHLAGKDDRDAALAAWLAQRDADDGCALMAATLYDAKVFGPADAWRKARFSIDANRPRAAVQAAGLVSDAAAKGVGELVDNPARYLARKGSVANRTQAELTALALMRLADNDPEVAAAQLASRWDRALPSRLAAWTWAMVAKESTFKLLPEGADQFQRATLHAGKSGADPDWPDGTLGWKVRAALRADDGRPRWQQVMQAIDAMSPAEQREAVWVYWKARALQALAKESQDGDSMRQLARDQLGSIAGQLTYYGALAAENLGLPIAMPARPARPTAPERDAAADNPGLRRGLMLIALGLRGEGEREWNYTLRGMSDRELLAAAQLACVQEVYKTCINTSERTRDEIDLTQRYPMPFRKEVTREAKDAGVDPAFIYGLIRQESRFIMDARSGPGASGLMQLMPGTARWTAKKIGLAYTPDLLTDRDTNLRLGASYLKLMLDDFGSSQPMAAAAYNAGPLRPRRWRDGPLLEPAIWAECIPFNETRDYVRKVLTNSAYYAALLNSQPPALKPRLGGPIGPPDPNAPAPDLP
ncbi:MAG: lytic transglycosylase domain-containing protein [Proteobacteria bacterium]|nr:lytic transglycosylase domain-containing protein [Pseudomonadota bacterium]